MNNIIIVLKLLPAIIEAMKAIEAAIPGKGAGEAKLAAIREILEGVDSTISGSWPAIQTAIGVLVKLFNAQGWSKA